MEEYLMDDCKNWGEQGCHPDVSEWRFAQVVEPGKPTPIRPSGEEQKKLDEICIECEFFEPQPTG